MSKKKNSFNPRWIQQKALPKMPVYHHRIALSSLSPNALIVIPYQIRRNYVAHGTSGIYKFDVLQNEWCKVMDFGRGPSPFQAETHCALVADDCIPTFYMFGKQDTFYKVDLSTNTKLKIFDNKSNHGTDGSYNMLCVNGQLHLILVHYRNGHGKTEHFLFDEKQNKFKLVHSWPIKLEKSQLIYLKSRKSLLLFSNRRRRKEYLYLSGITKDHGVNMFEFSLVSQKWSMIDFTFPKRLRTVVPIRNGKFLLFFSKDPQGTSNAIEIFDFKTCRIQRSTIRAPVNDGALFEAVCVNGGDIHRMLIAGYIRECYGSKKSIPACLLDMINNFVSEEFIHVIERNGLSHWKIKVDDIMYNMEHVMENDHVPIMDGRRTKRRSRKCSIM